MAEEKLKFEVKMKMKPSGEVEKAIFVGGEMFDYSVDVLAYHKACNLGPEFKETVQQDIVNHFVKSISEFIGRDVTMPDVINAIKTGWI